MPNCLITGKPIEPFINFGKMPIANGFLTPNQFADEYFSELKVGFNEESKMVQLTEQVDENKMFHENYAFYSSTSVRMATHFEEFATYIKTNYLAGITDPFVAEIGSNDGIMLKHFAKEKIRHLGIEPSANVAQVAIDKGINTITKFFNAELSKEIISQYGYADAFLGANVMCHIPYIHSVFEGINLLLKPKGVLVFEDPYIGDIVQKTSYDQIYDEHAFYYSVASVDFLAKMHNMEVVDVMPQHTHGGSMRYIVAHIGEYKIAESVIKQQQVENKLQLHKYETYIKLNQNIDKSRDSLMLMLNDLKKKGKRIVGYGATSKSTTVTNFCGITPEHVDFIADTTPIKQGKYSPGAHIPVMPYEEFSKNYPDYALLFAWNHGEEIIAKEENFLAQGGKFIVYVPEVKIIG